MDCSKVALVAVNGAGPNICGHMLIATGLGGNIMYFQVAVVRGNPKYMTDAGFRRYLKRKRQK